MLQYFEHKHNMKTPMRKNRKKYKIMIEDNIFFTAFTFFNIQCPYGHNSSSAEKALPPVAS